MDTLRVRQFWPANWPILKSQKVPSRLKSRARHSKSSIRYGKRSAWSRIPRTADVLHASVYTYRISVGKLAKPPGIGRSLATDVAADAVPVLALHRRLSRPHQYELRRSANARTTGFK